MNKFDLLGRDSSNIHDKNRHIIIGCVGSFFIMVFAVTVWWLYTYRTKAKLYSGYKKSLELVGQLEAVHKKINELRKEKQQLSEGSIKPEQEEYSFYDLLTEISRTLPYDVRLLDCSFADKNLFLLHGEALSAKSLTNFINNLKLNPCFKQSMLQIMSKKETVQNAPFDFTVKISLVQSNGNNKKISAR